MPFLLHYTSSLISEQFPLFFFFSLAVTHLLYYAASPCRPMHTLPTVYGRGPLHHILNCLFSASWKSHTSSANTFICWVFWIVIAIQTLLNLDFFTSQKTVVAALPHRPMFGKECGIPSYFHKKLLILLFIFFRQLSLWHYTSSVAKGLISFSSPPKIHLVWTVDWMLWCVYHKNAP